MVVSQQNTHTHTKKKRKTKRGSTHSLSRSLYCTILYSIRATSSHHQGSRSMTVEAAVRLRPTPPALSETSITVTLPSDEKLCAKDAFARQGDGCVMSVRAK